MVPRLCRDEIGSPTQADRVFAVQKVTERAAPFSWFRDGPDTADCVRVEQIGQ
jgi:hypothetical protein